MPRVYRFFSSIGCVCLLLFSSVTPSFLETQPQLDNVPQLRLVQFLLEIGVDLL